MEPLNAAANQEDITMNNLGNRQGADAPPAGAIPRPSWEYAQEPFDPSLTFMNAKVGS